MPLRRLLRRLQVSLFDPPDRVGPAEPPTSARPPESRRRADPGNPPDLFSRRWRSQAGDAVEFLPVPRMHRGWRLEWRRGGPARLRAPAAFLRAPEEVIAALARWTRLAMQRGAPARAGRKTAERALHAWLERQSAEDPHGRARAARRAGRRMERLEPRGRHHDLEAVLEAVNAEYFGGTISARITWSARWGGLSTQTTVRDAEGNPCALITISRGYDHPSATREIVGGVVYHECLHIAVPPVERGGRRIVHGREFRRREREYRHYEEWRRWHAERLPGIIRRGRRR